MMHNYKEEDILTCFKYTKFYNIPNRFYFIGDSRLLQVYVTFVRQFDLTYKVQDESLSINQNATYVKSDLSLEVNFIHKPIIDDSVYNLVEMLINIRERRPSFLVMGMGIEYMLMNVSDKADTLDWFKSNLTNLVDLVNSARINNESLIEKIDTPLKNTQSERASKEKLTPPCKITNMLYFEFLF